MARYKLTLAYDGTKFSGSQRQARGRTVQAELERALRSLGWRAPAIVLAGRTDAGVHAVGQVAALDFEWAHSADELRDALNAKLPWDVAVKSAEIAHDRFHPRFDSSSRRYRYQVRCHEVRDPIQDRLAWRIWPALPEASLSATACCFLGRHDFGAFGSAPRKGGGTIRTVTVSQWTHAGQEWRFEVAADGFLYRMVRRLVFIQVAVAQGRCTKESVASALERGQSGADMPAGLAPANGLILDGVDY
jgi:tRNA pseudouridine38-40 synthase